MDLYPKGGPVKAFVDDEAEEEDDSDNDLMRFQENEEDDGSDEIDDLKDLIASGFEEASIDHDKRNELHQKWLEQQDAAATDNVLQRLQSRHKQKRLLSQEEEDEEFIEDSEDESSCALPPVNVVHKNTKNAKQMIAQMFNDGNDVYVPSDDEESEQTLIRQRLLEKTVQREAAWKQWCHIRLDLKFGLHTCTRNRTNKSPGSWQYDRQWNAKHQLLRDRDILKDQENIISSWQHPRCESLLLLV